MRLNLRFFRPGAGRSVALPLLLALALAGCVTQTQVRDIVRDSNHALLQIEAGSLADAVPPDGETAGATSAALARLDAFEQHHATNPVTLDALRLRRALLYLNSRSFALAEATFDSLDPNVARLPRDAALYAVRKEMLWWWQVAPLEDSQFHRNHGTDAAAARKVLGEAAAIDGLPPEMRDYLLEMRAWIAVKEAFTIPARDAKAALLKDAVDALAKDFSAAERKQIAAGLAGDVPVADNSVRRVLRTQVLLDHVANWHRQLPAERKPDLHFAAEEVNTYFRRKAGLDPAGP